MALAAALPGEEGDRPAGPLLARCPAAHVSLGDEPDAAHQARRLCTVEHLMEGIPFGAPT
ncbi:hypothetical protein [Nonomuraea sp. KM90]|uniref:hypothetical protein n=1 Tax=Nonomuraea sp. KM90 TaxID=3457428 RepID=UPI003FCC4952